MNSKLFGSPISKDTLAHFGILGLVLADLEPFCIGEAYLGHGHDVIEKEITASVLIFSLYKKRKIEKIYVTCNGVPPLHDNLHKVIIKYEYYVRTNTIFSQYYPNR